MNLEQTKQALVKQLLNTNDTNIINHFAAVFATQNNSWLESLHPEVRKSIEQSEREAEARQLIPHIEAVKQLHKWPKK